MNYGDLLALDKETLIAKYKEVLGQEPEDGMGKQTMASAINNKLKESADEDNSGDNAQAGDKNPLDTLDEKKDLKDIDEDLENEGDGDTKSLDKDQNQKPPVTVQVKTTAPTPLMPSSKVVDLVKVDQRGRVIDTLQLTEAAYNNLPSSHKEGWKIKTPEEVQ